MSDNEESNRNNHPFIDDFEEAFRVIKIDEEHYVGAHPLRLPMEAARGVYGGNTISQTLLVGVKSASEDYVPHSFHSFFIAPGKATMPMEYHVVKINDTGDIIKRSIKVTQKGKVKFTALVSLIRKDVKLDDTETDFQTNPQELHTKYRDPSSLHTLRHTGYMRNAYSDEFVDHKLLPEENKLSPADRWIQVWSGVHQENNTFKDKMFNYISLGAVSDSVFLTTLARVLHAPWNPTETRSFEEVDLDKDARIWMNVSLNALHLFHYNAMSLDHHMYFHSNDPNDFDLAKYWLTFNYQARRVSNNRTLVRGHYYTKDGKQIATVAQEGLTLAFKGFETIPEETTNYQDLKVKL